MHTKEMMFLLMSICWLVGLSAELQKNYLMDFHKPVHQEKTLLTFGVDLE